MTAEPDDARVRRALEAIWNRGRLDLADGLFAPDYVNHGGLIPDLVRGPEAIKFSVALYRAAFPGLRISVETLLARGDTVALRWAAHRRVSDSDEAGADTGTENSLMGMTFGRLAGGLIVESWTCWEHQTASR